MGDTEGSFYCSCPAGFTLAADLLGCEDVNGCSQNPCSGTTCINTYGSYYCLTSSDVSGGSVAALVSEPVVASSASTSTVALAAVLAAVGSAMVVLIVVLTVRRIQTSRTIAENQSAVNRMNAINVSASPYNVGASPYGFGTVGSKLNSE